MRRSALLFCDLTLSLSLILLCALKRVLFCCCSSVFECIQIKLRALNPNRLVDQRKETVRGCFKPQRTPKYMIMIWRYDVNDAKEYDTAEINNDDDGSIVYFSLPPSSSSQGWYWFCAFEDDEIHQGWCGCCVCIVGLWEAARAAAEKAEEDRNAEQKRKTSSVTR